MTKSNGRGFTLVELMIVLAIVGILAALAAPAYQTYVERAQVSEGFTIAGSWKTDIVEFYNANGRWPSQGDLTANTQGTGQYESSIIVDNGVIEIIYGGPAVNPNLVNTVLALVPYTNDNNDIIWQCGLAPPPAGRIADGAVPVQTTVAPQVLPTSCKS